LLVVGMLLFGGKGKISDLMADLAKGIKSFKKGMAEEEAPKPADAAKTIEAQATPVKPAERAGAEASKAS
jgi:sec-independent protein translocase protein TatA